MSEPSWELLGGGGVLGPAGIDYIGAWAAGVAYQPGQIVRYNGVDYIACNPSTGQTPPFVPPFSRPAYGTSLPASPADGQEAILVDSLTNPSYQWHFRYNAGSTSAYKWEFVGGFPLVIEALGSVTLPSTGWQSVTANDFAAPRSGDYLCESSAQFGTPVVNQQCFMGVANASLGPNPIGHQVGVFVSNYDSGVCCPLLVAINAGQTLRPVYNSPIANMAISAKRLAVLPRRVA